MMGLYHATSWVEHICGAIEKEVAIRRARDRTPPKVILALDVYEALLKYCKKSNRSLLGLFNAPVEVGGHLDNGLIMVVSQRRDENATETAKASLRGVPGKPDQQGTEEEHGPVPGELRPDLRAETTTTREEGEDA